MGGLAKQGHVVCGQRRGLGGIGCVPFTVHLDHLDLVPSQPFGSVGVEELCVGVAFFDSSKIAMLFPVHGMLLDEECQAVPAQISQA